jgi:hypothetical protein
MRFTLDIVKQTQKMGHTGRYRFYRNARRTFTKSAINSTVETALEPGWNALLPPGALAYPAECLRRDPQIRRDHVHGETFQELGIAGR